MQINKSCEKENGRVALHFPLHNTDFTNPQPLEGGRVPGIALHRAANPAGKHWVSLLMTPGFTGEETDFTVEQQ